MAKTVKRVKREGEMGKVKRSAATAASGDVCAECGGGKRGRGYQHVAGCSMATKSGSSGGSRRAGGGVGDGELRRMGVAELVALRSRVDEMLAERSPEIDAEIERLKRLKAEIKGR